MSADQLDFGFSTADIRARPARPRKRDELWDTLDDLFGVVVDGTNAHKKRNKAVKDLKLLGATPELVRKALTSFQTRYATASCTDTALATHYPMLAPRAVTPPCPSCGIGSGFHASDCDSRNVTASGQ